MIRNFQDSQWAPFPVELVFAFFANPQNIARVMPPHQKARVEDMRLKPPPLRPLAADPARRFQSMAAGVGSEILVSLVPIGWLPRLSWTVRIIEFEWYSHFTEEQVRGPFAAFRHRYGIEAEHRDGVEGTRIDDTIDYALPTGILGPVLCRRVWRQLEEAIDYRKKKLPEVLAAAAKQAVQKAGSRE